jgi:hypothetical protein
MPYKLGFAFAIFFASFAHDKQDARGGHGHPVVLVTLYANVPAIPAQ